MCRKKREEGRKEEGEGRGREREGQAPSRYYRVFTDVTEQVMNGMCH